VLEGGGVGGSVDVVLSFEEQDDAARYADMLAMQDLPEATPVEMDTSTLLEFCDDCGHVLGVVKRDQVVVPPEANVDQFQWSPGTSEEGSTIDVDGEAKELDSQRQALEQIFFKSEEE